jgi:hypothetical protein
MSIRSETILSNASLTAGTFQSATLNNDGRSVWSLVIRAAGPGASPSLTFSVLVSMDGTNWIQAGPNLTAIVAAGNQRNVYAIGSTQGPIVEPFIQVQWVVVSTWSNVNASLVGI